MSVNDNQFATACEDLEPSFGKGTNELSFLVKELAELGRACAKDGTEVIAVIDAEGQNVCFAARNVAERIILLLNEDCNKNPSLYGV